MCGILGFASRRQVDHQQFTVALNTLTSRGPDATGILDLPSSASNLLFGHKRLAIIDLSADATQPMSDASGNFSIVFNGEIYNFRQIRERLEKLGYVFRTNSDTEVLLTAYIEYGERVVELIEGMFAFAVHDRRNQSITLVRDHFGKKPIYYYWANHEFVFASEIKAILAFPEIKQRLSLNISSIGKYLVYGYIPSPHSIFNEIHKLSAASLIKFDLVKWQVISKHEYWNPASVSLNTKITEADILAELDYLILESVKKRMVADVPVGVFLSGGIDSSLITAMMRRTTNSEIKAFTVAYSDYKHDESAYAKEVANQLGVSAHTCFFEGDLVNQASKEILSYIDEPMADAAIIPLYFIAKYAKNHISVVLSGDGGDELFGGYTKYRVQQIIENLHYLQFAGNFLTKIFKRGNIGKLLAGFAVPFHERQFIYGSGGFLPNELLSIIKPEIWDADKLFEDARICAESFFQNDIINKSLYLDSRIQLPDWYLVKGDRATMATSLEMRNPLLDKKLTEFAFSLPGSWKIHNGEHKYLLKKLAEDYFHKDLIYRKKKGFAVPLEKWIDLLLFQQGGEINLHKINPIFSELPMAHFNKLKPLQKFRLLVLENWAKLYF